MGEFCRSEMPSKVAARTANRMLSGCETVRPEGGLESYPWMLVGTAFDYRVRMFFEPDFNFENTVALGRVERGMMSRQEFSQTAESLWLAGVGLDAEQKEDNEYLARLCIIAAHLENAWRGGVPGEWLLEAENMTTQQRLDSIPAVVVNDVAAMSEKLGAAFSGRMPESVTSNPVLGSAELMINADADLVLDDCLVEIKATVSPRVRQAMLHQAVCYALLDRDDRLGVRKVGLYMARQGALIAWSLPELLMLLGAYTTDVGVLRGRFEEVARRQLTSSQSASPCGASGR